MKKLLLSSLFFLSFGFGLIAQDEVEIFLQGQTTDLSSGAGPHQMVVSSTGEHTVHFDVRNISGTFKNWRMTRYRIDGIPTWSDYMCWGYCYTAGAMSSNPWTSPASTGTVFLNDGESSLLDSYITPDASNPGTVTYRYYVTEDGVTNVDSVDIEFTFALSTAALSPEVSISVSPNPATETITVKASGSESGTVRIVDVLGNVVFEERYNGTKKVNVSDFRNGVYFVMVDPDNGKAVNKKIVVRH